MPIYSCCTCIYLFPQIYTGSRDGSLKGIPLDLTVYYECKVRYISITVICAFIIHLYKSALTFSAVNERNLNCGIL